MLQNKLELLPKKFIDNFPNLLLIKKIKQLNFMFTNHVRSKHTFY